MMRKNSGSEGIRVETGTAGLDDILTGGLLPNRLYLINGDPGAGKTTFALRYLIEGVKQGERCLYITLSETRDELLEGGRSHGWDLSGVEIVELGSTTSGLEKEITMYPTAEVELGETTNAIFAALHKHDPSRVVLDSLSELRLLAQNPLRYRRQILALKQFLAGRRCTALLLDDGTAEGSDIQLESLAHGVVCLEQLAPLYGAERRRLRVMKIRGSSFRGGYHDFVIRKGGIVVFPRIVAAERPVSFERKPIASGVGALDALLGGGLDRGTSILLMGPAGCGKSSVAIQYAMAAALRGEPAVVFAFDESAETLIARTTGLGMPIEDVVSRGLLTIRQVDPAEMSPGEFAHEVKMSVEQDGARVIIIDSLNGYLNAMPEEDFLTVQLHELLTYLGRSGVTTIMVAAQHGLMGENVSSPVDTSYLADSVVLFRYFEHAGNIRKAISVMKKRSGHHESSIRELTIASAGVQVSEPLSDFRGLLAGVPVMTTPPDRDPP